MTDKEFKRLSRPQLIDIIYQLQLKQNELESENQKLAAEVTDKRIRMTKAGNIAEASLAIHGVMQAAQDAAALYVEEIRLMHTEAAESRRHTLEKAQKDADAIVLKAQKDANALMAQAKKDADAIRSEANRAADTIRTEASRKADAICAEANRKADAICAEASRKADAVVAQAKKANPNFDSAVEAIIKEYTQNNKATGEQK